MTRAFISQTNFSAGELDPRMLGRTDLRSFENGAAKLRNVVVETTGGVRRRPGMATWRPPPAAVAWSIWRSGPASPTCWRSRIFR